MEQQNTDDHPAKTHQERSWRNLIVLIMIALSYLVIRWIITLLFPSVPCNSLADATCRPYATMPQLLAITLVSLVTVALGLLRLPIVWQESSGRSAALKWLSRAVAIILWLWLLSATLMAIVIVLGRVFG